MLFDRYPDRRLLDRWLAWKLGWVGYFKISRLALMGMGINFGISIFILSYYLYMLEIILLIIYTHTSRITGPLNPLSSTPHSLTITITYKHLQSQAKAFPCIESTLPALQATGTECINWNLYMRLDQTIILTYRPAGNTKSYTQPHNPLDPSLPPVSPSPSHRMGGLRGCTPAAGCRTIVNACIRLEHS